MPGADAPNWMNSADTLNQLAEKLDINIDNFTETVDNFNNYVDEGNDKEFSRGESDYDSFYGRQIPRRCFFRHWENSIRHLITLLKSISVH